MKSPVTGVWLVTLAAVVLLSASYSASAQQLPNPIIYLTHTEYMVVNGKQIARYHYDVSNKSAYPADLFVASPSLPPCGTNTRSSRTWVDVFDQHGKRLNGFCAIGSSQDLNRIWFALDVESLPPSWIYLEFVDRQTNTKYKSNLAETTQ